MEQNPQQNYRPQTDVAPVMSTGSWIGTLLLMYIPIVNIILLIVWAASTGENPNRRNFARAYLLMFVISFILMAVIIFGFGLGLGGLAEALEQQA